MSHHSSDTELLESATPDAFAALFDRHALLLRRWLRAETRDGDAAADLLAETFAQAWAKRRSFRAGRDESAWPWLFGIARNLVRQWRRRGVVEQRGRHQLGMLLRYDGEPYVDDDAAPDAELAEAVADALSRLPSSQREALRLRVVDDLDYAEIARRLSVRPGTARIRVHRALQSIRAAIPGGTQ